MHIKAEGMTQFDIFHVFVENSVNSELCFFLQRSLSKRMVLKTFLKKDKLLKKQVLKK